ncbi:hypothetical protein WR25_00262 [Diploscapter pachys]|uniref:H15 domain-containing protein n=1 Tax=Diploscapter pachys TaxID=2018661 RepID=A0A2A2JQT4_9BILA|nr:hypothetical protein WR25_00262 [Diploscapter pachys]
MGEWVTASFHQYFAVEYSSFPSSSHLNFSDLHLSVQFLCLLGLLLLFRLRLSACRTHQLYLWAVHALAMAATDIAQNKVKSKSSKTKTVKAAPSHPPYLKMIQEAIVSIKDRKGATRPAIKTFLLAKYNLNDSSGTFNRVLNSTLKKGVADGTFKQPHGNHGRFGLGEGAAAIAKKNSKAKKRRSASIGKKNSKAGTTLSTPKVKSAKKPSLARKKKSTARMGTGLATPTSSKKAAVKKSARSSMTKSAEVAKKKKKAAKTKSSSAKAMKKAKKAQTEAAHSTPTPLPKKASSAKKQPPSSSRQFSTKETV